MSALRSKRRLVELFARSESASVNYICRKSGKCLTRATENQKSRTDGNRLPQLLR
jgi:hypothetical protein